ncbi:DUF636 domain protein [Hypoxylon rubiginosum]|uniref:DUF636 domain protein n=1 Tax=Hypoxylon rubiginosum TaxID=110542 RepID=A0ACB9Z011_9PEZI|nr:DUF636 domain protein [Hypoxylon rubiginosum]
MSSNSDLVSHKEAWIGKIEDGTLNRDEIADIFMNMGMHYKRQPETFVARCHCGNIHATLKLAADILPLNAHICSCTVCRVAYGSFGGFHVTMAGHRPPDSYNPAFLQAFQIPGTARDEEVRWFCRTCGARHGIEDRSRDLFAVETALFDKKFWKFTGLAFPVSTGDGGLLDWHLPSREGDEGRLVEYQPFGEVAPTYEPEVGPDGEPRLRARCCCGGVSFTIPRPGAAVRENCYMSRFISPVDKNKWKAYIDFSTESRLVTSAHFTPWMLVPRVVLEPVVPPDLRLGTMRTYRSSDRVLRGFCGRCGATVFMKAADRSPAVSCEVLNVAMGILRAPEGVRAENWVTWRAGKPEFVKDGKKHDEGLTGDIESGLMLWSLEESADGDAPTFDIT